MRHCRPQQTEVRVCSNLIQLHARITIQPITGHFVRSGLQRTLPHSAAARKPAAYGESASHTVESANFLFGDDPGVIAWG